MSPTFDGVSSWLAELPARVAVAYEAGPTGFGLARQLTADPLRGRGAVETATATG